MVGATQQIKGQAQHLCDKGDEWTNSLRANVRSKPLSAIVTAFVLGALIARITR